MDLYHQTHRHSIEEGAEFIRTQLAQRCISAVAEKIQIRSTKSPDYIQFQSPYIEYTGNVNILTDKELEDLIDKRITDRLERIANQIKRESGLV